MNPRYLLGILFSFLCIFQTLSITIDFARFGRTFEGVGALSGGGGTTRLLYDYPEPVRSEILDILFKPNYGASLHILKVEIGGDAQSTEATEASHMHTRDDLNYFRGYEWWLMSEAKKRNPEIKLYGLAWGAPGWIGNGNYWSTDCINYLVNWIKGAKSVYHIDIDYIGVWNEHGYYNDTWIIEYRKGLDQAGFGKVKIIAPDDGGWSFGNDILNNKELANSVYAIGSHYPYAYNSFADQSIQNTGIPLWASECWNLNDVGDWQGAQTIAETINGNYIKGNMTATVIWTVIFAWYPNLPYSRIGNTPAGSGHGLMTAGEPWSGNYTIDPPIFAVAHTTQFSRPGWRYLAGEAFGRLSLGGSYVTLSSGSDFSIVIETSGSSGTQTVDFQLTGFKVISSVNVWRTVQGSFMVKLDPVLVTGNRFSVRVDPNAFYTITTTEGQGSPDYVSKFGSKPFPIPYSDDFDSYYDGATVKYFTDQGGSFAASKLYASEAGFTLAQAVPIPPIKWRWDSQPEDPITILGDTRWTDYSVKVSALLETKSDTEYVMVIGRISGQVDFRSRWFPSGYALQVYGSGNWYLKKSDRAGNNEPLTLASGTVNFAIKQWNVLQISFKGNSISVYVNGSLLKTVVDSSFSSGMCGIGSGYHSAYFDHFSVENVF